MLSDTMENAFTIITRPIDVKHVGPCTSAARLAIFQALAETATTGQALRIPLNGQSLERVQTGLRAAMQSRHLRFSYRRTEDGLSVICWARRAKQQAGT